MSAAELVFLHGSDELYGSDRVLLRTVQAVRNVGREVRVILPESVPRGQLTRQLEALGVRVERAALPVLRSRLMTPSGFRGLLGESRHFMSTARDLRASVVVANTSALLLTVPLLRLAGVPEVMAYVHERWEGRQIRALGLLVRFGTRVIAISHAVQDVLPKAVQERTEVVYNGVPRPSNVSAAPPGDGELRVLFVGRTTNRKGLWALLDVWASNDALHLTIVGGPPPGDDRDVGAAVAGLPNVTYVGEVQDVGPYYRECHVVIVPCLRAEGLGLVAIEALAYGRPVLATKVPGLTEVIDDETGWFLDAENPANWPVAVTVISPDAAAMRFDACRQRYETLFSLERFDREVVTAFSDRPG